jgi:hypothetical protein
MLKLAAEFGMSKVALAKVCMKHKIPRPSLGYWATCKTAKKSYAGLQRVGLSGLMSLIPDWLESGLDVSELFPNVARHAVDLPPLRSASTRRICWDQGAILVNRFGYTQHVEA